MHSFVSIRHRSCVLHAAISVCHAELEMLMLGGSALAIPVRDSQQEVELGLADNGATVQEPQPRAAQLGHPERLAIAIVDAVQMLSHLKVLELTFFKAKTLAAVAQEVSASVQVNPPMESSS